MGLIANFLTARKLRSLLIEAIAIEAGRIGVEQTRFVKDYIEHGEWGLAHDQLTDALEDADLLPMESTALILREAERLMRPD